MRPRSFEEGRSWQAPWPVSSALRMAMRASESGSCCMGCSSLAVLLEPDLGGHLAEALAAQVHAVAAHDPALAVAALAALAARWQLLPLARHLKSPQQRISRRARSGLPPR